MPGGREPYPIAGKAPNGVDWTKIACSYRPAWAAAVARRWIPEMRRRRRKDSWEMSSPMMVTTDGDSHMDALKGSNFAPTGGRSLAKTSDTMATELQPTRKALPQLLPDGLPPHLHLQAALAVKHPMA